MNYLNYINTLNILISMLLTLPKNHTKLCYVINQLFIKLKVNIHFYFYINSVKLLLRIHLVRYILITTMMVNIVFHLKGFGEVGNDSLFLEQLKNILLRSRAIRCNLIYWRGGGSYTKCFFIFIYH